MLSWPKDWVIASLPMLDDVCLKGSRDAARAPYGSCGCGGGSPGWGTYGVRGVLPHAHQTRRSRAGRNRNKGKGKHRYFDPRAQVYSHVPFNQSVSLLNVSPLGSVSVQAVYPSLDFVDHESSLDEHRSMSSTQTMFDWPFVRHQGMNVPCFCVASVLLL